MSFRAFDWLIVLLMRKCMCCIRVCRQSKRGGLKCAVLWETSANLKYMKGNRSFAISERASCCPNGPPAVADLVFQHNTSTRLARSTSHYWAPNLAKVSLAQETAQRIDRLNRTRGHDGDDAMNSRLVHRTNCNLLL